jgi:hypothetical protein
MAAPSLAVIEPLILPPGRLASARICSRLPYESSSEAAVFSPIPATPGRPSEASPRSVA